MYIEEDMINTEEMSKRLETSKSNLRKWCLELEANGYSFRKDTRGQRSYTDHDQMVLMKIKYAIQEKKLTKELAVKTVIEGLSKNRSSGGTHQEHSINEEDERSLSVPTSSQSSFPAELMQSLKERFEQQEMINKQLMEALRESQEALRKSEEQRQTDHERLMTQLNKLQEHIDERLTDRDRQLMQHIRSSQQKQAEQHKQQLLELAAAKEEQESKKSFLARLFGK